MTIKVTIVKGEGLERSQETGQRKKRFSLGTFLSSKTEEKGGRMHPTGRRAQQSLQEGQGRKLLSRADLYQARAHAAALRASEAGN